MSKFDAIQHSIRHGLKWPFFRYNGQSLHAWVAMCGIMADTSDRSGLSDALGNAEIPEEERVEFSNAFEEALVGGTPAERAERVRRVLDVHAGAFGNEWDQIDKEICEEILAKWALIIEFAYSKTDIALLGVNIQGLALTPQVVSRHDFLRRVGDVVDAVAEDLPNDDSAVRTYTHMQKTAEGILKLIDGDGETTGYRLVSRSFAYSDGLDISGSLHTLFDNINS